MLINTLGLKGHRCFRDEFVEISAKKPVTVIIGKNNSGKSQVLELLSRVCHPDFPDKLHVRCKGVLTQEVLARQFRTGTSGGGFNGDHWEEHGSKLIGREIEWEMKGGNDFNLLTKLDYTNRFGTQTLDPSDRNIQRILEHYRSAFAGKKFVRLLSERDIVPEPIEDPIGLKPGGAGATNMIGRYLHNSTLPRDLIRKQFLEALREVFGPDASFDEITTQMIGAQRWEVFLGEPKKGLVALSASGSGLKTIILVLLVLLVLPFEDKKKPSDFVFALEELENNLHPALVRRLFRYIEAFAVQHGALVYLTTHSSVAVDFFGSSPNAQILRVRHDGSSAKVEPVHLHFDRVAAIAELGAKPSDVLQANCVVWVEGPSDRIYLNTWIELFSDGHVREGRDYQCACYGGALLSANQFASPENADQSLINLLRLNSNAIVVCDSDRRTPNDDLKARVKRIEKELSAVPSSVHWITECKEIENYLPASVLTAAGFGTLARDPGQFESFFPTEKETKSYWNELTGRTTFDKVQIAAQIAPYINKDAFKSRFDLPTKIAEIVQCIKAINS